MQYAGVAETIGVQVDKLTPDEVVDIWPLAVTDGLIGAIRHLRDGISSPLTSPRLCQRRT